MVDSKPKTRCQGTTRCPNVGAICAWCGLAVENTAKASGLTGKADDPVLFPKCRHALHAACLRAWEYDGSGPQQRALLSKRRAPRHLKCLRGLALASYDYRYGGACHQCAPSAASAASASSDTASSAHGSATSATNRTGRRGTCACQSSTHPTRGHRHPRLWSTHAVAVDGSRPRKLCARRRRTTGMMCSSMGGPLGVVYSRRIRRSPLLRLRHRATLPAAYVALGLLRELRY